MPTGTEPWFAAWDILNSVGLVVNPVFSTLKVRLCKPVPCPEVQGVDLSAQKRQFRRVGGKKHYSMRKQTVARLPMSVATEQPTHPGVARVSAATEWRAIVIGRLWPSGTNHSMVIRTHVESM